MNGVQFGKDKKIIMTIRQHQLAVAQDDDTQPAEWVHNAAYAAEKMRGGRMVRAWASVAMLNSVHMFLAASAHVDR